jgi:predicted N-acetyltransferase YhbS
MNAGKAERLPTIRPEQPTDHEQVFQVKQLAFGQSGEARLVHPQYYPRFGFIPGDPLDIGPIRRLPGRLHGA